MNQRNQIKKIYTLLYQFFGAQHWWPSDTVDETIIGAILTQNVAWTNVEKALINLKKNRIYLLEDIIRTDQKELSDLILPSRFSRQKAVYLHAIANFFKNYNFQYAKIAATVSPAEIRYRILSVKGVGDETGDTILLYALEIPYFVIDAYTKRIFYRIGLIPEEKIKYQKLQDLFHKELEKNTGLYNEYHALLVKLGKDYCMKNNRDVIFVPCHLYV